jgi:hypothetical protein
MRKLSRKNNEWSCSLKYFLHIIYQLGTLSNASLWWRFSAPLLYIILESTDTLKSSRLWVCITQGENSLQSCIIFYFWDIVSFSQPLCKRSVISVEFSPYLLRTFYYICPPPRINIKMIQWVVSFFFFRRSEHGSSIKKGQ